MVDINWLVKLGNVNIKNRTNNNRIIIIMKIIINNLIIHNNNINFVTRN